MKLEIWKRINGASPASISSLAELLIGRELAPALAADGLQMIPLVSSPIPDGVFAPPGDAIALERVARYGTMILENRDRRPAIVPLQLGYLQKAAQNHALCAAALIEPQSKITLEDACCIQQGQGGLMTANEERFIVLPHPLRAEAFLLRGQNGYSKLWKAIAKLNGLLGLKVRGHLDELKHQRQPELVRVVHQLERVEGQTGAVFMFNGRFVGLELAPDATFWAQIHTPLVMYCYAPLTLVASFVEAHASGRTVLDEEGIESLAELRRRLAALAEVRKQRAVAVLEGLAQEQVSSTRETRASKATLFSLSGKDLSGQAVLHDALPAYASVFSTSLFVA